MTKETKRKLKQRLEKEGDLNKQLKFTYKQIRDLKNQWKKNILKKFKDFIKNKDNFERKRSDAFNIYVIRQTMNITSKILQHTCPASQCKNANLQNNLMTYIDSFFNGFLKAFDCPKDMDKIKLFFDFIVLA